jgi:tetratricopeptide (TPR) repeat protein
VAGNRRVYEAAVKRAGNLAWEKKWSRAIEEYSKALAEFPEDVSVLTGLGLAYAETQQLEQALEAYKKAANLSPDNPEVIQRVAQTFERMALWPSAAHAYVLTAEAHLRLRNVSHAVEMWQKASVLDPENLDAHRNLGRHYRNQNEERRAARHYMIMARVFERQNKMGQAAENARLACELDPRNAEAQGILDALQAGEPLPDGPTARLQPDAEGKRTLDSFVVFEDIELGTGPLILDEERASPADMLREHSLAEMANALFAENPDPKAMQANLVLGQAADFQTRGLIDRAINAYASALRMGANTPAVHFNLGLLYREQGDYARAVEYLNNATATPSYALGAHFAMGETYYEWGKSADGLGQLLEVLLAVDAQTVRPEYQKALEAAYEQLYHQYASQADAEDGQRFIKSMISFLSIKGWEQRLQQVRQQLDSLAGGNLLVTMAEMLTEPSAETAMVAMTQVARYLKKGLIFTALEECFWSIQQAPYYLPLHLRLADIQITEGRPDEAVEKYINVAETYKVRGNLERAVAIYRKALDTAPMNIGVRERLISILVDSRLYDQAIEQYIVVADSYYQLAQVDQAIAKYNQALEYAPMGAPDRHWEENILHRIGDIHQQRLDWRQAIKTYRRIKHVNSDDEKARAYLVDLYLKTAQSDQALPELDDLIKFYKGKQEPEKLLSTLRDIAASSPRELSLHMRLAKTYLDLQMKTEAITELDVVGNIQLESGKTQEAIRTIQAIIRLGPENVRAYRQLLAQLQAQ